MASSSSSLSTEQQPRPPFRLKPSSSSSFTPSRLCLEFLSCLQTDQVMQIHKINDVVIPTLIHNLSNCNPLRCSSENGHRSPLQATYDKINGDLSDIKDTLERLKEWEDRLNTLTKKLMLFDWEAAAICTEGTNSVEVLQTAIPEIHEMVSGLKSHISLPLETCLPPKSSDISLLPIPKNAVSILKWSENFAETDAFVNFKERYDSLSFQQQESLLYFSFFPDNSQIRKKVLTYFWIGEGGVIQPTGTGDSEEIADQLFKDLSTKGFIEPVEEKDIGDFNVCSIKPDVRSALLTIAHTKGFLGFDSDGNPTANSCRAYLEKTDEGSLQHLSKFSNHDKLRTLFNINENCLEFPSSWLSKTKNISVIHLGNWSSSSTDKYIEAENPNFLEDLRDVKLLRCLSLNGVSGITKLPDSISTSENLDILDLKSCRHLEKLPRKIGLLKKLTHMDMSGCYLLDEMPEGIAFLSELRVLKGFIIGRSRKKGSSKQCTLSDLAKLEKLRKLSLYADKETTGESGELNCLSEFRSLQILAISWIVPVPPKSKPNKKLKPTSVASPSLPTSLEKLDLRCWPSPTMPSWIKPWELNSLKKLYIRGGKLSGMQITQPKVCDSAQWTVKILRFKFLRELRMDWKDVGTLFPSLVYIEKVDCPELSSFPVEGVWRSKTGSTGR
ncbi:hypothetical protein Vadar_020223 [Vaccinium darrowii]|uniref:Uncharacterized protein n=1 Tax=Vaccinium darrowii TaxID=229202 RepID=A0ACB7ZCT4_9ERIC|nr:hypothetical protein Vadar_020223 [Vaccinium darrowii]